MISAVESRLPFLDYRLVEFCISLPDSYKIRDVKRKFVLRRALKNYLPRDVYMRYDKIGFEAPQELWMEKLLTEAIGTNFTEGAMDVNPERAVPVSPSN